MTRSILLFFIIFLSIYHCKSQIQISEIQNPVGALKFEKHGVANIDGVEYLIESNDTSMRVSKIDDEVIKLYEESYPSNYTIHSIHGDLNTNSGYEIEGIYLYELFTGAIRKRNLETGEIVATYETSNYYLKKAKDFDVEGDIFHFVLHGTQSMATYHIETDKFNTLPYSDGWTFRSENIYYAWKFPYQGLFMYDATDNSEVLIFEDEYYQFCDNNSIIDNRKGLVLGSGWETRFINSDTTFIMDCQFDFVGNLLFQIHEAKTQYVVIDKYDSQGVEIRFIDKSDCSISKQISYEGVSIYHTSKIFDIPSIHEEYLFIGVDIGSYNDSQLLLYNKNTTNLDTIAVDANILSIDESTFFSNENHLYFMGYGNDEPFPDINLYALNFENKTIEITNQDFGIGTPLSFGFSKKNETQLISNNYSNLAIYNFGQYDSIASIGNYYDTKNAGIPSVRYLGSEYYNLAFKFRDQIYFSSIIYDTKSVYEADQISDLIVNDQTIKGLVTKNDTTFYFTYNANNEQTQQLPLDMLVDVQTNTATISNFIFGDYSINDKLYFDTETVQFLDIPIDGDIVSMTKSKDHLLFLSQCGSKYCLTSFVDGSFFEFAFDFEYDLEVHSKENGEFFVLESISDDFHEVYAIGKAGEYIGKTTVYGIKLEDNQETIVKGDLGAMMFFNNDELIVITQRSYNFNKFKIPFTNADKRDLVWYKTEKSLILKSEDQNEPGIYACTLGKEPKKLDLNNIDYPAYNLLMAVHKDNLVSIIVDSPFYGFEIALYDEDSQNVNSVKELNYDENINFSYDYSHLNHKFRLSQDRYFLSFVYNLWWENENTEPLIFNAETVQAIYFHDINEMSDSSNPDHFLSTESSLYFIAKSPKDNSYQLFMDSRYSTTPTIETEPVQKEINVVPNPSQDYIKIESNSELINIYNVQGSQIISIKKYSANDQIDIQNLDPGIYFIESFSSKERGISKFVKL